MKSPYRNSEGYRDPTAGIAISRTERKTASKRSAAKGEDGDKDRSDRSVPDRIREE